MLIASMIDGLTMLDIHIIHACIYGKDAWKRGERSMESASNHASKRIPTGKVFKASAIDEAGDALAALEASAGTYAAKATVTAADIIEAHLEAILRMQGKGIPLAVVYKELKTKVKLRIEYKTFKQYVSRAAVGRGISRRAAPATSAAPAVVAESSASPATEQAAPEVMAETASEKKWNCAECETKAERRESTKNPGQYFWRCSACGTNYRDNNAELTSEVQK